AIRAADVLSSALLERTASQPELRATLAGCSHFSPFLKSLLERHTDFILESASQPCAAVIAGELADLSQPFDSQLALRTRLRQTRQRLMLLLGLADCGGVIDLPQLTKALSDLADQALEASLRFELGQLAQKGDLDEASAAPETCGIGVLALGKLGGQELNYSSDIDIVAFFDPERFSYCGRKDQKSAAVHLMRNTFGHLSARTAEGFVFRIDLRLRPDPSSTPIVMTLDAAETYYQSQGRTWERAALIKARHSCGDAAVTADFLERIQPFVWRRHLDYAAIDDVHAMKQRVHAHHQHDEAEPTGLGYDVKLGHGGIREIEFFAQIQQLIMGGRRPDLQTKATCDVLTALREAGDLSAEDHAALINAYGFFRQTEHRLQMVQDEQTHCLPDEMAGAEAIAQFQGLPTAQALFAALQSHREAVSRLFDALLGEDEAPQTDITLVDLSDKTRAAVERWHKGGYRAMASARARALFEGVLPDLLKAFDQTPDPGETALIFDTFIEQLPAGVQIFSLLDANRALIPLMANIMGQSPELAAQLTRRPALFEGLIDEPLTTPIPGKAGLAEDLQVSLAAAQDYESTLDLMRIWNGEVRFQAGARLLEGLASPAQTRAAYSDIADVALPTLLEAAQEDFARQHGTIEGSMFGIVALGSFGARELVTASDLDLTFLYTADDPSAQSSGPRPLPVNSYFARLAQRVITGLTSLTSEGRLYDVDMRLRPSGRSGIIAVSLDAFTAYHQSAAWIWERMSLTKSRFVAGPPALEAAFQTKRADILSSAVPEKELLQALWDMRGKLYATMPKGLGPWAFKGGDGGLRDADFLVEGLALKAGASDGEAYSWEAWWGDHGPASHSAVAEA
ncbi:MAG: bifunctional [glutamine synthetase] adenylyltransferase/[glutamine synthetase]-adenylyl-L-tyrosine phosphorylase, partial [Pseudomonadota bacterium]